MSTSKIFLAWIGSVAAIDSFVVMMMWHHGWPPALCFLAVALVNLLLTIGVLLFGLTAMSKC